MKWTPEAVEQESKKYKTRWEFQKGCKTAYNKAWKNGWLDSYTWLGTPIPITRGDCEKIHCVYIYIDVSNKTIYVGRTVDIKTRHRKHRYIKRDKECDSVCQYFRSINKELPQPVVLCEKLSVKESQYYEDYFVKMFRDSGWNVLNRGKTGVNIGSIGSYTIKLTYEYCKAIALTCKTRKEFERKNSSAYSKSIKKGWIDEFIPYKTYLVRTFDECREIASKYSTMADFRENDCTVYLYCRRKKWLRRFHWLNFRSRRSNFNIKKADVIEKSRQFEYSIDFRKAYPDYYETAKSHGWLRELNLKRWKPKYTYEYWYSIAVQYDFKQQFRKDYPELVQQGYLNNWFSTCNHFKQAHRKKLTKDDCLKIASKYSTVNELRRKDETVYNLLIKNDWMKDTSLKYIRK